VAKETKLTKTDTPPKRLQDAVSGARNGDLRQTEVLYDGYPALWRYNTNPARVVEDKLVEWLGN